MFRRVRRKFFSRDPDSSDGEPLSSVPSSSVETEDSKSCPSSVWSVLPTFQARSGYCYVVEDVRQKAAALSKRKVQLLRPLGYLYDAYGPRTVMRLAEQGIATTTDFSRRAVTTSLSIACRALFLPLDVSIMVGRQALRPIYPLSRLVHKTTATAHGVALTSVALTQRVFYASLRVARLDALGEKYGRLLRLLHKLPKKLPKIPRREEVFPELVTLVNDVLSIPQEEVTLLDLMNAKRMYEDLEKKRALFRPALIQPQDMHSLPMMYRFIRFAVAAYGRVTLQTLGVIPPAKLPLVTCNDDVVAVVTGIPQQALVASSWEGSLSKPAWFVCLDHETATVVVAFRGTACVKEAIALACEGTCCCFPTLDTPDTPGGSGYVHAGFHETASAAAAELRPTIESLLQAHPNYQVVLTGHSFGAAIASLVCLHWAQLFPDAHFHCFAFEQPCVLSLGLCVAARARVTALLAAEDMSPRFELASVLDLREILLWACGLKPLCEEAPKAPVDTSKDDKGDSYMGKLYPPGRLFYLHPNVISESRDLVPESGDLLSPCSATTHAAKVELLEQEEEGVDVRVRKPAAAAAATGKPLALTASSPKRENSPADAQASTGAAATSATTTTTAATTTTTTAAVRASPTRVVTRFATMEHTVAIPVK